MSQLGLAGDIRAQSAGLFDIAQSEAIRIQAQHSAATGVFDVHTVPRVPEAAAVDSPGERVVEASVKREIQIAVEIGRAAGRDRYRK